MSNKVTICSAVTALVIYLPAAWAAPCTQKDPAELLTCKMATAKTQAEADVLIPELAKLGDKALPAIEKVLKSSKNGKQRAAAACTVEKIGPRAAPLVSGLLRVMSDEYVKVRLCALRGLQAVGPAALAAMPALRRSLGAKEIQVQIQTIKTVAALWPTVPAIIPQLVGILDGKRDKRLKYGAARILANYGAMAMMAIPALRKAMFAPDPKLQGLAVAVVDAMAPASWTECPSLLKLVALPKLDPGVRKAAAVALGKMGNYAKKFKPTLEEALKVEGAPTAEIQAAIKAVTATK